MKAKQPSPIPAYSANDFVHIRGQEAAKRAVTVALAGGHSFVLIGPRGWGRTMLINAAGGINPNVKATDFRIPSTVGAWDNIDRSTLDELIEYDIHVEVPAVPIHELLGERPDTSTTDIRRQVEKAQKFRSEGTLNGRDRTATSALVLSEGVKQLAKQAISELGLSAKSFFTCVRVARTIADLACEVSISESELAEAIQYRLLDRR